MSEFILNINGERKRVKVDGEMPLLWVLRDTLGYTGTKFGCGRGLCGACTIHIDGEATRACVTSIDSIDEDVEITTIEGLAKNGKMHPMQEAFKKHHGLQCGFCTPGMVMSAVDLLQKNKNPNEQEIRDWLEGNLCRCTGYQGIVEAVKDAASKM